jgi:hypothetical protein
MYSSIIWWAIALLIQTVSVDGFSLHSHFPSNVLHNNSILFHELALYIHQHNRDVILNEGPGMCNRTYAIAVYNAPEQVGNHMHEFLNNFIGAYATNRTVLWHYCDRKPCTWNPYEYCQTLIHRMPWIMHYGEMKQLWEKYNCAGSSDAIALTSIGHRPMGEEIVMCCGLDQMTTPNVYFGTNEQHEYFAAALPNARFSPVNHKRAQHLFQRGEHFGYGAMFYSAFKFTNMIVQDNVNLIRAHIHSLQRNPSHPNHKTAMTVTSEDEPFYVSIHIRHSALVEKPEDVVEQDTIAYQCFENAVQEYRDLMKGRLCVILLAADRNETMQYWMERETLTNCTIVVSNHSDQHAQFSEHGPYTGEIAIRDLELLSRGDVFIGSTYLLQGYRIWASSFSMLIAELRSMNGRKHSLDIPPRFIPECQDILGGRRVPKSIFNDPALTSCKRSQMQGVFLPEGCPLLIDENN